MVIRIGKEVIENISDTWTHIEVELNQDEMFNVAEVYNKNNLVGTLVEMLDDIDDPFQLTYMPK